MIKTNKRKKYLQYSDVYNCLDCKWNYDFSIYGYAINKHNGIKTHDVMILEFTKGYQRLTNEQLERLKNHISNCYPKAIIRIVTERHKYAPELNKDFISVSTKL